MKLNIGCGKIWEKYPGYDGLDLIDYGQKFIGDVFIRMATMHENVYDEVMANHFIEHLDIKEIQELFRLVKKVLKPNGLFRIVVPHKDRGKAYLLSHKFFFTEDTFKWLELDETKAYDFDKWKIEELITNEKKDIHCLLRVIK